MHCSQKSREYDEAIQAYDKAIQLDPNHVNAWISKGLSSMYKVASYIEANEAYARAKELGYTGPISNSALGFNKAIQVKPATSA